MLQSKYLTVRKLNYKDIPIVYNWIQNKRISKFLSTEFRLQKINLNMLKIITKKKDNQWYIFNYKKNKIGCVIIDSIDKNDKIANLWYFLGEEIYLGNNLTFKAINKIFKKYKFKTNVMTAWTSSSNKSSIKLLRKLDFKKLGSIPNTFNIKKNYFNRVLFYKKINE